jgi:ABC-type multidrug transport system permease subunit
MLQVLVELPYMLVQLLIFSSIVYPMIGFQLTMVKFFWFFACLVMSFMYYTLFGMVMVALTPNIEIAMGLSFLIFMFRNIFSGVTHPQGWGGVGRQLWWWESWRLGLGGGGGAQEERGRGCRRWRAEG